MSDCFDWSSERKEDSVSEMMVFIARVRLVLVWPRSGERTRGFTCQKIAATVANLTYCCSLLSRQR